MNNNLENQKQEMLLHRETEDALYKVLMSEAGRRLIDHWLNKFVHTSIALPTDTNIAVGLKQGQANFVMMIKNRINLIEKGE